MHSVGSMLGKLCCRTPRRQKSRGVDVAAVVALFLPLLLIGCGPRKTEFANSASLADARRSFHSNILPGGQPKEPAKPAPANTLLNTITYPSPVGQLAAYITRDPRDGAKHPAIIWITGGDCNSIGDVWTSEGLQNDQTAAPYRMMGIVTMYPSLRGGNANPGVKEGFLGEVDDVLAAADYLEKLPYVDPKRIYLGGHSTGGTMALLVAESSPRFRCVFSFGPIDDVANYGPDSGFLPIDIYNRKEVEIRSPIYWLSSIKSPVWVFEGTNGGNIGPLLAMKRASTNPNVHFIPISGATHFSTLGLTNELIAKKILSDTGEACSISFTEDELNHLFAR